MLQLSLCDSLSAVYFVDR